MENDILKTKSLTTTKPTPMNQIKKKKVKRDGHLSEWMQDGKLLLVQACDTHIEKKRDWIQFKTD